jgi:hypothetical protein
MLMEKEFAYVVISEIQQTPFMTENRDGVKKKKGPEGCDCSEGSPAPKAGRRGSAAGKPTKQLLAFLAFASCASNQWR